MDYLKSICILVLMLPISFFCLIFYKKRYPPIKCFLQFLFIKDKDIFLKYNFEKKYRILKNIQILEQFNVIKLPQDWNEKVKLIHRKQVNFKKIQTLKKDLNTHYFFTRLLITFRYEKKE